MRGRGRRSRAFSFSSSNRRGKRIPSSGSDFFYDFEKRRGEGGGGRRGFASSLALVLNGGGVGQFRNTSFGGKGGAS